MSEVNWLDNAEKFSRMLSIVAIPVVLAIGGWWIQRQLQDQSIRRDYVQLALTILQNPDTSKVPPEIREWAVDLLNENSPTKLNAQAIKNLKSGSVTLPAFNFVATGALTPELQRTLESSLQEFKTYLENLGFQVPPETTSVKISPGTLVDVGGARGIAFWDPNTHSIVVASAFASDRQTVLRQYAHNLLIPGATQSNEWYAIESGLATYLSCSFTNSPVLGQDATAAGKALASPQDLRNHRLFKEISLAKWDSVQNDGSEVWGGTFWEIRQVLGQKQADQLITESFRGLTSQQEGANMSKVFANSILSRAKSITDSNAISQVRSIFERRGMQL